MTESSTFPAPADTSPSRSRGNEIVSWIVIVASIGYVFLGNYFHSHAPTRAIAVDAPPAGQLLITSRYVVGFNSTSLLDANPTVPKGMLIEQVAANATTDTDRLRVVAVAGELAGGQAALHQLDKLGPAIAGTPLEPDSAALRIIYDRGVDSLTAEQRKSILEHHGWFGALALSYGKSDDDPLRRKTSHQALLSFAAVFGVAIAAGFGLLIGFVLLVIALLFWIDRKLYPAYTRTTAWTGPFLEAFALFVGAYALVGLIFSHFSAAGRFSSVRLMASLFPAILAVAWPLVRGISFTQWRIGLGWHAGRGVVHELFAGWIGYIAGLPILAIGFVITYVLIRCTGAVATHPIINEAHGFSSALKLLLLAAVWAPLAEESLFRGMLFHHLRSRHGWWISSAIVSLLFAALHPQGWAAIPALMGIAMVLAAIREWRATIIASAAAHALNNAVLTVMLVVATS